MVSSVVIDQAQHLSSGYLSGKGVDFFAQLCFGKGGEGLFAISITLLDKLLQFRLCLRFGLRVEVHVSASHKSFGKSGYTRRYMRDLFFEAHCRGVRPIVQKVIWHLVYGFEGKLPAAFPFGGEFIHGDLGVACADGKEGQQRKGEARCE